jgi:hypothetical protein
VTAAWSGVSSPTTTDWIGLYRPGDPNTSFIDWIYDDSCSKTAGGTSLASGSCSFTMPTADGTYQLRLLSNDGYTVLATSNTVTVTGGTSPTLTANPSTVAAGGSVTAAWSGVPSPTTTDWIGLYHPGDPSTSFIDWMYDDSCSKTPGGTGQAAGSCSFPMPSVAGTYELRLLSNDGYTVLATSNAITVTGGTPATLTASPASVAKGAPVTAAWSGVSGPTSTDWIGVYHHGDPNTSFIDWIYDDTCTKTAGSGGLSAGSCSFTMPSVAGTYELRLLSHDGYTVLAVSNTVTVS